MKKYILSIILILTILLFSAPSRATFVKDIIVTSPDAVWTDSRAYATLADAITAAGGDMNTLRERCCDPDCSS